MKNHLQYKKNIGKKVKKGADGKKRCFGNGKGHELYARYHDEEWGRPVHKDHRLFELLILEAAQAGLSWEPVLNKREAYRQVFFHFDPEKVAGMTDDALQSLQKNSRIIRNRRKIFSARKNARVFLQIQKEFGSFDRYIWSFVGFKPIKNAWKTREDIPKTTEQSDALSKDLKKRGMSFVGSTIMYAFMQAGGMVNDHLTQCWCYSGLNLD